MWIRLERGFFEQAIVHVHGRELRLYEERNQRGLCSTKGEEYADPEGAHREAEKIVARRMKSGWATVDRVESPWTGWLLELERLGPRIAATATDVGLSVEHTFKLLAPRGDLESITVHPEYRDLVRSATFVRHHLRLWREGLRLQVSFELRTSREDVTWAERQWVPDALLQRGALTPDGGFEIVDVDRGDVVRFVSADELRATFLSHVGARADAAIQSLF